MSIIDKLGKTIAVTNLPEAIAQADLYRKYNDPQNPKMSKCLKSYWTHLYKQLIKL